MIYRKIEDIDWRFKVATTLPESAVRFYDVQEDPFDVYGLYNARQESAFKRLPDDVAASVNDGVRNLCLNTAGGRVRFSTDSPFIAIRAVMPDITIFPHMTLAGTAGFDLYLDTAGKSAYYKTFMPPSGMQDGYESVIYFPDSAKRSITINFPLYSNVRSLFIGLQEKAFVGSGSKYRYRKPVLYYGSSITQGGCASRPGNSYQAIISRHLNCDFINLGFSGSALAEDVIVDYMAKLDISAFVCDYDHNAPDPAYLGATHERLYQNFRKRAENVPILFITRPDFENGFSQNIHRREIIFSTYAHARDQGDANVHFIDGESLFGKKDRDCCTVDGCHPNDAGFLRMAEVIERALKMILKSQKTQG